MSLLDKEDWWAPDKPTKCTFSDCNMDKKRQKQSKVVKSSCSTWSHPALWQLSVSLNILGHPIREGFIHPEMKARAQQGNSVTIPQ